MRLKSFTAASMAEAMQLVREELGDDAIIVSTQRAAGGKGIRITAALEDHEAEDVLSLLLGNPSNDPTVEAIRVTLADHGAPLKLIEALCDAVRLSHLTDPLPACTRALENSFVFAPLPDFGAPRPFLLTGPPGSGKSLAVAKLAARSALKQKRVGLITCDNLRAGATEQLAAFTRILNIPLGQARGPDSLQQAIDSTAGTCDILFIDTPGLNPFKLADMEYLTALAEAGNVEPILVLAAGGDPLEAGEIGQAFAEAGTTRLIATRLDTTRRLGGILAAAAGGALMFCDVSATPHVVNGMAALSASLLARLILPPHLLDAPPPAVTAPRASGPAAGKQSASPFSPAFKSEASS